MRARLEEDRGENALGSSHPAPPVKQTKSKEPILSDDNDAVADDELSSSSSPLPDLSPQRTMWRLNRERGPRAVPIVLSVACISEYEEKSAKSDDSRSMPPKMCPLGTGAVRPEKI